MILLYLFIDTTPMYFNDKLTILNDSYEIMPAHCGCHIDIQLVSATRCIDIDRDRLTFFLN